MAAQAVICTGCQLHRLSTAQAVTMNLFVHCQNLKSVTSRDMFRTKAYHLDNSVGNLLLSLNKNLLLTCLHRKGIACSYTGKKHFICCASVSSRERSTFELTNKHFFTGKEQLVQRPPSSPSSPSPASRSFFFEFVDRPLVLPVCCTCMLPPALLKPRLSPPPLKACSEPRPVTVVAAARCRTCGR